MGPGIEPRGRLCPKACTLELRPGSYTVYVASAGRTTSVPVHVRTDSDIEVTPPSQTQRTTGIGFVATGSVLVAAGLSAFVYDTVGSVGGLVGAHGGDGYESPAWVTPVEIAGGVGALAVLVGVGLITTNSSTVVVHSRTRTLGAHHAAGPRFRLALASPTFERGGAGLRLGWRF